MSNQVRIGIVGAGSIAIRGIMPHLAMADIKDQAIMTAVCDPVFDRAQAAAAKFGIANAYASYDELLDSGQVDALSIASPIGLHYEQGMKAVERGLHLHFNKTMTTTVDEADALIARAAEKGAKLVSSPGEMLRPLHRKIREMIQGGALGTLTWAVTGSAFGLYHEKERVRLGNDPLTNINPSWYWRRPGGGPLYDMTVYGLHAMTGILGPAKRVTAFSGVRVKEREFQGKMYPVDMDDNTLMVLDFGDNFFAFAYGVAAGSLPNMGRPLIFGTQGVINGRMFNNEPIQYDGMELDAEKGMNATLPHIIGTDHQSMEEAHVFEDVMQLVDWIRDDKPTVSTAEHARHVIEIFDAAYRSAETGQAQDLKTTFDVIY